MITPHENKTTEPIVQKRRMNKWVKRSLWVLFGLLMMVLLAIGGVAYYYYPCSLVFHETWNEEERKELSSIYDQMKLPMINNAAEILHDVDQNSSKTSEFVPFKTYYSWKMITDCPKIYVQADNFRRNFAGMIQSGKIESGYGDELGSLLFISAYYANHRLVESLMKRGGDPFNPLGLVPDRSYNALMGALLLNPTWKTTKTVDDMMLSFKTMVQPGDKRVNGSLYLPIRMIIDYPDSIMNRGDKTQLFGFLIDNYLMVGTPIDGPLCVKPINPMRLYLLYGDTNLLNKMVEKGWDINETYGSDSPVSILFKWTPKSEPVIRWALENGLDVKVPIQTVSYEFDENGNKIFFKNIEPFLYALMKSGLEKLNHAYTNLNEGMDSLERVADLAIQHGADINATDAEGKTILDVLEGMKSFDEEDHKMVQRGIDFLKKRGAKHGRDVDSLKA